MFNIGAGEMIFIVVAALLVLGPQRLPELARGIGKFLREFRRQTDEVRTVVEREFYSMEQDIQREPPPSRARAPSLPPPSPLPEPGAVAALEGQPLPPPALAPVGAVDSSFAVTQPMEPVAPAAPAGESEGAPGPAPLPGTVARNAPKQS
jgi:sec-independent protein translocase protein TatB